ncbi:hypothetical protein [Egicoccus sp. AB-alg2]|uniref:hypothetical protein n=1 Tax=Egicoccus sp. AB-alg2 TaxID=3242693 RepID=UPI00359CED91
MVTGRRLASTPATGTPTAGDVDAPALLCPFDVGVDRVARFMNCELADHPVYDGLELQWFDDDVHGRGLLAFLSRREDRRTDYYAAPELRLDRATYHIGGGTGAWVETVFDADVLEVGPDGVRAEVRFLDREGREIEIVLDDREAGPRRSGVLLAPVGAGIDAPASLLLVVLHGFDLLRRTSQPPRIHIDGREVSTGILPGAGLHRRHLVKAAAPLVVATVCRTGDRALTPVDVADPGPVVLATGGHGIAGVRAEASGHAATFVLDPALPALESLPEGRTVTGAWEVAVDGNAMTGGVWQATRAGERISLGLDVTEPWRPPSGLPPLLRAVTRLLPTFRRWPTTYRWRGEVRLASTASLSGRWERTTTDRGERYRRATASAG